MLVLCPTLLAAALLAATAAPQEESPQTTVSARAADGEARSTLPDAAAHAAPADLLAELPGVTLLHDGAPLAPTRVSVRGASGARMSASFAGLSLADPLDGMLDVEALPWSAVGLAAVDGSARALRLEPDRGGGRMRARLLVGSLSTLRAGALARVSTARGAALAAADVGMTRGDFLFAVPSPVRGDAPQLLVRENDDHRRASALLVLQEHAGPVTVDAAALGALHEGGVPGFATHPTRALRREDLTSAARARATLAQGALAPFVDASVRGSARATFEDGARARDTVDALSGRAAAGVRIDADDARLGVSGHVERARVSGARLDAERLIGGGHTDASLTLPVGLTLEAAADADVVTDAGPLLSGHARASIGDTVRAAVTLSRLARPPTLDELYAPRGFVLGNPALAPEVTNDVEGSVAWRAGALLSARAALWAGRIEDTILYLNRNAFEIAPENTGPALRAGVDGALSVTPARMLAVQTVLSLLASRMDATGAPLPLAPAFAAVTSLRVGPTDGGHVVARATSRGASHASLFGTLPVAGYTLVDLIGVYPLHPALSLGVSVKNAFDVLDARDQNGLPLPGRLVFVSLEVTG